MSAAPGLGLGGIIVVAGVIYYTGVGGMAMKRIQTLDSDCRALVPDVARAVGDPLCGGIGYGVDGLNAFAGMASKAMADMEGRLRAMVTSPFKGMGSFGESFDRAVAGLASPGDRLGQLARSGPGGLQIGRDASQQLQQAVDSFSLGQRYLAQGSNNGALTWLAHGAAQPEGYGVLSQLSLGDLYRNGGNGIAADPLRAQAYYQQAANSLVLLNQSDTPQAQQLLQTLPVSPQVMQQQLLQAINQLKSSPIK